MREGVQLSGEDILEHCRGRLARFKVPAQIIFTDGLPQTGSGKVLKHLLPRD
ncbi:MAG: hypothetical protein EBS50_12065 [Sphingomonadaceae bacterium]|nr:hypothetical protein [Sphingomonadaceae bacterium]